MNTNENDSMSWHPIKLRFLTSLLHMPHSLAVKLSINQESNLKLHLVTQFSLTFTYWGTKFISVYRIPMAWLAMVVMTLLFTTGILLYYSIFWNEVSLILKLLWCMLCVQTVSFKVKTFLKYIFSVINGYDSSG